MVLTLRSPSSNSQLEQPCLLLLAVSWACVVYVGVLHFVTKGEKGGGLIYAVDQPRLSHGSRTVRTVTNA